MIKQLSAKAERNFDHIHQDLLDNMPSDMVKEMARRRLDEIAEAEKKEKK
jgi:hypothetical protein